MKFRWTVEYRPTNWVETVSIMVALNHWLFGDGSHMTFGNGDHIVYGKS